MGILRVETSSYSGKIEDSFLGFDTARFVKSTLYGLVSGNGIVEIETSTRNDNSSVVEHVHSINSVTKERRSDGFLESNRDGSGANSRLALSRIAGPLNISDVMTKSATQKS